MTTFEKQTGLYCKFCQTFIFSNSRHDFVSCKCDYFFIDGGFDYIKAGANSLTEVVMAYRYVDRSTLPKYFKEEENTFDTRLCYLSEPITFD